MAQISLFDGEQKFVFDKPIRLIELFAGYGSQHFALEYLGLPFQSWKIAEWSVKSIQAYKDAHFRDDNTDYSAGMSLDEVIDYLFAKGISADYNQPMTRQQIARMGERCRTVYNNIQATHNLVSVCNTHAKDLEITETDKFTYLLTYSFPCQDLSKAGLGKGMAKDSGTRSGLLWEVERILDECENLPQVLLMENVPDVIGTKNIKHFAKWLEKLESLGYKCYWQCLNAKHYGVPQSRDRCFMVSILGDYFYEFPRRIPLEKRLKDVLETNVDEKYYLRDEQVKMFLKDTENQADKGNGFAFKTKTPENIAGAITTREGKRKCDNFIECECIGSLSGGKWDKTFEQSRRVYGTDGLSPTLHTTGGGNQEIKILDEEPCILDMKRKCQVDEVGTLTTNSNFTGAGVFAIIEDFPCALDEQNECIRKEGTCGTLTTRNCAKHNNRIIEAPKRIRKLTPLECFRLMGVKDEDFNRIAENQSNSSLYHLAGDSIVVDVLTAILGEMK